MDLVFRMKIKKTLLFSIIIFSLFSSLFSINSLGITPDINYTFDQDILFDDTIDSYNTSTPSAKEPYNLRYQQEYTEIYNATYSFTNDIIGGNPSDWNIDENGGSINIVNENSHNKVLELFDNSTTNSVITTNSFPNQTDGIIEFWWSYNAIETLHHYLELDILENAIGIIRIRFNYVSGQLGGIRNFGSAGLINIIGTSLPINTWRHIKIITNSLLGTYEFFLNEISYGIYKYLNNITSGFNTLLFQTRASNINPPYTHWIDGIGYFFENFDFEVDNIADEPLLWNIVVGGTGIGRVFNFQGSKVLRVFDTDNIQNIVVSTIFSQSIDQSIEYYIAVNDTSLTDWYYMRFKESGSGRVLLRIDNNDLDFHNGISWNSVKDDFIVIDTWFKITINLHDSTNTFDIFVNDILEGSNLGFITNSIVSVNQLSFESGASETSITYLDNFNINSTDFKNYFIGQNIIPFLNISKSLQEVNKYEFALNDIHTFNEIGSSNPNGWTDLEVPSGNKVVITEEPDASYDRVIKVDSEDIGDVRGITKNFSITSNIVSVSFGFFATIMDGGINDVITFRIFSFDNVSVLGLQVRSDLSVRYSNGTEFIDTNKDIVLTSTFFRYDFNITYNYEINIAFFQYYRNNELQKTYTIYLSDGHYGISKVQIYSVLATANNLVFYIDNIGIYDNGKSKVETGVDFGIALIDTGKEWNRKNHNLITFVGNGTFHIASTSLYYFHSRYTPPIKETTIYNNEVQILNGYDDSIIHLFSGVLVLTVLGNNFNFSYLKISGVILNDTYDSYNLIFEYSEVNLHESFFYTDTNNKLQFTHTSNDTDTEYIQARFNINDSTSTDASISFRSLINNNAKGFFRINYTTTSDFIPFPIVQTTTSIFLTQGNNIRDFLIIITDLDDNNVNGLTSGFIDNIKLVFLGNIQISVITLSLIGMIVPLIIILTPTVALRDLYGESFVIPIFLLMSLILTIGQIIPIWLFFIIAISNSLFLIKENIQKDD